MESDVSLDYKSESQGYMYGEVYRNSLSYTQQSTCVSIKDCIPSPHLSLANSFSQESDIVLKISGGNIVEQPFNINSCRDISKDEICSIKKLKADTVMPENVNISYNFVEKDLSCLENSEDIMFDRAQPNDSSTKISKLDDKCLNHLVQGGQSNIKVQQNDTGNSESIKSHRNKCADKTLNGIVNNSEKTASESKKEAGNISHKKIITKVKKIVCDNAQLQSNLSPLTKEKTKFEIVENSKHLDLFNKSQSRQYFNSNHFCEMFARFYEFQKLGKYCDVRLCMEDGNILAHSLVLISANSYFHKLYKSLPKIYSHIEPIKSLTISNIPHWAMDKIVTYLYTGETEIEENRSEDFIKYCSEIGIVGLKWKNVTTPVLDNADVVTDGSEKDSKLKAKKLKINVLKSGYKLKENAEKEYKKCRKRKNNGTKQSDKKPKKIKLTLSSKLENADDDNKVTIKVEKPDNNQIKEDSGILCDNFDTDNDVKVIDDRGNTDVDRNVLNVEIDNDNGGDDTDSYFEVDVEELDDKTIERDKHLKGEKVKSSTVLYLEPEKDVHLKGEKESTSKVKKETAKFGHLKGGQVKNLVETFLETVKDEHSKSEMVKPSAKLNLEMFDCNGGPCEKCGRNFVFQHELTAHRNKCAGKNNRQRKKCVTCNLTFDCTEDYLIHRNNDTICIALRQEKLAIKKQKRLEMRQKFACCVCPRKFRRNADKIEHEFTAHEIKYDKDQWPDLYCEFCNYWTMNPWKLHLHKQVSCSKGQEPICDMCGNTYKNEKTLKKHKELMHIDIQPMLTCEECGKSLKGKKGLQHHIRLQHRKENLHNHHMCHMCSQTYRTRNDLTFHLYKAHDQPLPQGFIVYQCNICDYVHNNKKFYERHIVLHEDKKEWLCGICSKAFKTKNSLRTHMTVHTSQRIPCPFDDCTYKALKNCHLKDHIENQHTQKGEKREKCHLCEYSTFFKGNLVKHQRTVHKLEVVTRYNVEMKAKYKNLKSGQILGLENETSVSNPSTCISDVQSSFSREVTSDNINVVSYSQSDLPYTATTSLNTVDILDSACTSIFQDKPITIPVQHVVEPLIYTASHPPLYTRQTNYHTMYNTAPLDITTYYASSTLPQI